ncbi:hypothetical protein GUITHDRAFT_143491 [Guillardia theta CCMP2712]|uniref:Uncharacterized protein n=1 Tax=Guillardia theta (strain CCMP2712) TaxID=905079 RepID=L1ITE9_GUITC|nr:hypothetical protein GUITHDRAFT_143491 [Guillardia theta CCMP2712]EKX39508.1 hypothetical protein GUITHDRAFT_143491 [Guillardia theta CCMP2712]|eukprot:XP_005826488.1 hypothetical protein GUITHDRAFT_143491 [Guillardia theta CCMP2712]
MAWWRKTVKIEEPVSRNMMMASFDSIQDVFLQSESWAIPLLPFHSSFLDLILALDTCASYRRHMGKAKHPWLQVLISCAVGTFGGTTVAALFLGQPPGWMGSLSSPFAFLLAFWLIFCCPGNVPYKFITRHRSVELVFGYINSFSCGHATSSWGADGALKSCGGGILANWLGMIGKSSDWMFGTPPVLKGPSMTVRTAFFTSCVYYLLRNPHEFLPYGKDALLTHDQARTCIWLLWVFVLSVHELLKVENPWEWLTRLVGVCFLCPDEIGGAPEDGVYEMVFGKGEKVTHDAALSGFGFDKKDDEKKKPSKKTD